MSREGGRSQSSVNARRESLIQKATGTSNPPQTLCKLYIVNVHFLSLPVSQLIYALGQAGKEISVYNCFLVEGIICGTKHDENKNVDSGFTCTYLTAIYAIWCIVWGVYLEGI